MAQIGATIGREFSHELIAAVSSLAPLELDAALERLTASGLTSRRGIPPIAIYSFKHALVQDAAYATMLKSGRRQLHARIAEAIEQLRPEATESEPELLAWHYTRAGRAGPAIEYWRRAGQQSVARYANREAIGHFERALEQLAVLALGEERDWLEADLRLAQAVPLIAVHGYGAQEVEFCALRAKELADCVPAGRGTLPCTAWSGTLICCAIRCRERSRSPATCSPLPNGAAIRRRPRLPAGHLASPFFLPASWLRPTEFWHAVRSTPTNSKLRDELLAGELFSTLHEAKVLIEQWRRHYNAIRPHSSLGYRPPAPETILPPASALPYAALRPAQTLAMSGRSLT